MLQSMGLQSQTGLSDLTELIRNLLYLVFIPFPDSESLKPLDK